MPPFLASKNRKLYIRLHPLIEAGHEKTVLTADIAAASGTLTVKNINKFAINQILLIGELGAEDSEIIKTHASSAPSGSTITLASNTTFAHSRGTNVYLISFDQVELSHSATLTGSKTVLTTTLGTGLVALEADDEAMVYNETEQTSGFYFARFKNSIAGNFGGYTDGVPYGGFATDTVGYAIDYALRRNSTGFTPKVTHQFCIEEVNACLKNIKGKQVHWPEHVSLNAILGQTVRGQHIYSLPSDIYDNDTNKSIIAVRVGDGQNLIYKDPEEWEDDILGAVSYTQVKTQASAGATSLAVDNSYDFEDSGSLSVYVSGSKDTFTYTVVTRDTVTGGTAAFTGIPSSGDDAIGQTTAVDTYVWQGEEEGKPLYFTVRNGNLEIWPIPDGKDDNKNIYSDYETEASEVDTDGDTLDTDRSDMVKSWLTASVRAMLKNDGVRDLNDPDYTLYREALNDTIKTKRTGLRHPMKPKLNRIAY